MARSLSLLQLSLMSSREGQVSGRHLGCELGVGGRGAPDQEVCDAGPGGLLNGMGLLYGWIGLALQEKVLGSSSWALQ